MHEFPPDEVKRFKSLFASDRSNKRYGEYIATGWTTRYSELTDEVIASHLRGERTIGAYVQDRIILEIDFTHDAATPENVSKIHDEIFLNGTGFQRWKAIREAGEDLGIAPDYWVANYTGGRSLQFWLIPDTRVQLGDAHAIAKALKEAVKLAGFAVCTAYPTSPHGKGKLIRLPCGRHNRTKVYGHFVELGLWDIQPQAYLQNDADYLSLIERVPEDVLTEAATIARKHDVKAPPAPPETKQEAPSAPIQRGGAHNLPRLESVDPKLACRIGRPCILYVIENGVEIGHRHETALHVRAELKAAGYTVEEAEEVYLRFAAACSPAWPREEALYDLRANWEVTDISLRHSCRETAAASTIYFRDWACVRSDLCAFERMKAFLFLWRCNITADAQALYLAFCMLEAHFQLRPGDAMRTTQAKLQQQAGLSVRGFKAARKVLEESGLSSHQVVGRGQANGTYSFYKRTYPVPAESQPQEHEVESYPQAEDA